MRKVLVPLTVAIAAAIAFLGGCSGSGGTASTSGSPSSSSASPSATTPNSSSSSPSGSESPSQSPTTTEPTTPSNPYTLVSQKLAIKGNERILVADALGDVAAAAVQIERADGTYDVGLVVSRDQGSTWKWSGVVRAKYTQYVRSITVTEQGIVLVGDTSGFSNDQSTAFIAAAAAPDYALVEVAAPSIFSGNYVHLTDMVVIGKTWFILGQTGFNAKDGWIRDKAVLWTSSNQGDSWKGRYLDLPVSNDTWASQLVVAPDGSWNIVGQAHDPATGNYDAAWWQSTDGGISWLRRGEGSMSAEATQSATRIIFSPSGAVAIWGWDEITSPGDEAVSVIWTGKANKSLERLGRYELPVSGGTPPGAFIDGVLFEGETLIAWGRPDGKYPSRSVQFYRYEGGTLNPSTSVDGEGNFVTVDSIVVLTDRALLFGANGPYADELDAGIWLAGGRPDPV